MAEIFIKTERSKRFVRTLKSVLLLRNIERTLHKQNSLWRCKENIK